MTTAVSHDTVVHPLRFFNQSREAVETFASLTRERFEGVRDFAVRPLAKNEADHAQVDHKGSWRLDLVLTIAARTAIEADRQFAAAYSRAIMPVAISNRVFIDGRAAAKPVSDAAATTTSVALAAISAGRLMVSAFSVVAAAEVDETVLEGEVLAGERP